MPVLYLYELSSFTVGQPNEGGGDGGAVGTPNFTIETGPTLSVIAIDVTDNDNIISENGANNQVLTNATTINGVLYPAGTQIRADYYLTSATGEVVVSISVGGGNTGADTTQGIASSVPLDPNQSYVFTEESNANPDYTPSAEPQFYVDFVVCFAEGTEILTQTGPLNVENLAIGDHVMTMDHGYQSIRWIGSRTLDSNDLARNPKLKPIRIRAGALGAGLPEQDLVVSPQHRMLVRSIVSERMFGKTEVLIPTKKLLGIDGIDVDEAATSVTYYHFLFTRHEIVFANGAPSESLFTGAEALKAVSPAQRQEITSLFPEILSPEFMPSSARPIPEKGHQMYKFAGRVSKNNKFVLEEVN
ncbi:Hint domain-containing protein [Octadecabacter sp.]|nr:Hint domain-containing protein [Octadecabacter sp.]